MDRLAPFDKIGQLPVPDCVNADPTNGVAGSILNMLMFNQLQHEGVNLELLAKLGPDTTNLFQWAQAVSRGGIWVDELTGTGDLAVATLNANLPAFLRGMRVGGVATAANTTTAPKLRVMNLGSTGLYQDFPITLADGSAPAIGAIKAGRVYRYEADGAGNVMISGGGIGSGTGAVTSVLNQLLIPGGRVHVFTSTTTEFVPLWADCSLIGWMMWGAGGGGAGDQKSAGAGGGFAWGTSPVTGGAYLAGTCGAGGFATVGGSAGDAGNGNTTTLSLGNTVLGTATGGQGGNDGPSAGGMGYGGNIMNRRGGPGEDLYATNAYAAGGSSPMGGGASTGTACAPGGGGGAASTSGNAGVPNRGWPGADGQIIVWG